MLDVIPDFPMNTEEAKQFLADNPLESAYGLLVEADPNFPRRFHRACTTLKKLLEDVREYFPEAEYYTASGGFHIVIGETHSRMSCSPNTELCAIGATNGLSIDDGDW